MGLCYAAAMTSAHAENHHKFHRDVYHKLVSRGHEPAKAAKIAQVVSRTKAWIDHHVEAGKDLKDGAKGAYDVYDKGKTVLAAGRLIRNPMMANSLTKMAKIQNVAGAGVLSGAADVLEVA